MGGSSLRPWSTANKVKSKNWWNDGSFLWKRIMNFTWTLIYKHIYSHCPAHDEICLVVCNLCGRLIKAQAFEQHWDRCHGPLNMKCSQPSGLAHQQGPRPGLLLLNLYSLRETVTKDRYHDASYFHTTLPAQTHKDNATYKEINEKMMLTSAGQSTSRTYSWIHRNQTRHLYADCECWLCPPVAH